MKKLIVVTDWGDDTLTCQEVRSAVEGFLSDPTHPNISFVSSSTSTIHTSFLINQIVLIEERFGRPLDTVIFENTDTRTNAAGPVEQSKGADLVVIRLKSGIHLIGPNAGYDFTFIKSRIDAVFTYPGLDKGSQFRSRDLYARVAAHLMDSLQDDLELEEVSPDIIPELQDQYIGHIDNYGNIKTTITFDDLKGKYSFGDILKIRINNVEKEVKYVSNLFGGELGQLVIYPGSSGDQHNPYLEISVWRHFTDENTSTGVHAFSNVKPGMKVEILQK